MTIDINRLGPAAQKQIADKLMQDSREKAAKITGDRRKGTSKYKNIPTTRKTDSGAIIRFDSLKEAARYDELMLMLKAGEIRNLRLQPEYTLQEAYTTPEGKRVRAIRYRADYSYEKRESKIVKTSSTFMVEHDVQVNWVTVVEDVKGKRTDMYKLKKKMMLERLGIEIQEV